MGGQAYPWVFVLKNHLLHRNLHKFISVFRPVGRLNRLFY
mgnify:FL=1|jgi:hypothetical protein|nr:MAG TPA: hypothetical protein [Caudoviricetes sp.]DAU03006.1 MAG TPA: hypothetical protein [Caudoviricetes sp.]